MSDKIEHIELKAPDLETLEQPLSETPKEQPQRDQYNHDNPRPQIPEGMSKSQWKKQQRKLKFIENKATFQQIRRDKKLKKRAERRAKIDEYKARGEEIPKELRNSRPKAPENQVHNGGCIVIDCSFDDLMSEKEVISLSNQITRAYSSIKFAPITTTLKITSLEKKLKKRFDEELIKSGYLNWKNIEFQGEEFEVEDPSKCLYLSADSENVIEELDPSITYIVGGIVDKNRHKNLCKNKAEKLGIETGKLPIGDFIDINGRTVLTTGHVVEIMISWYQSKNWKQAFETVLPPRKMGGSKEETTSVEPEEADGDDDDDYKGEEEQKQETEEKEGGEKEESSNGEA